MAYVVFFLISRTVEIQNLDVVSVLCSAVGLVGLVRSEGVGYFNLRTSIRDYGLVAAAI